METEQKGRGLLICIFFWGLAYHALGKDALYEQEKCFTAPDPHGNTQPAPCPCTDPSHGSTGTPPHRPPTIIPTPSHGGGYYNNPPSGHIIPNPPSHGSGGPYNNNPPSGHIIPTPRTPSHGGGGYYNNPPSGHIILTPPTPSHGVGGRYGSPPLGHIITTPPTPSHHGGGYYNTPPSGHNFPITPTPTVPLVPTHPTFPVTPSPPTISVDPNSPPFSCNYWRTHPAMIWGLFGYWGNVGQLFGSPAVSIFGGNPSVPQALANTRTDGYGALYREGTAALLNSMANSNFAFTTQQVKDSFNNAIVSDSAAAAQAEVFKKANEGHLKH